MAIANTISDEKRNRTRRSLSVSERVTCKLLISNEWTSGSVIGISPGGLSVIVDEKQCSFEDIPVNQVFKIVIEISGYEKIETEVQLKNLSKFSTEKIQANRLGLTFYKAKNNTSEDRRKAKRFKITEFLQPSITFENPIFEYAAIFGRVTEIGLDAIQCETSSRNNSVLPGMKLRFTIAFPLLGSLAVTGEVVYYTSHQSDPQRVMFGVRILSNHEEFQMMSSELLVMSNKDVSTSVLQDEGFMLGTISRAVSLEYAFDQQDLNRIAELRLKAWQHKGYFIGVTDLSQMFDKYDHYSRHLVARVNGKIVASARLVFNNGYYERCEHSQYKVDIPEWLWKAGFVETSRLVTDPEYRGGDLFLMMTQQIGKTVLQSGFQYMVSSCEPSLEKIYLSSGCTRVTTFNTPDSLKPWCLLVMDVGSTIKGFGMNPIFWNIVQKPITNFLLKRNFISASKFQKLWIASYKLFGPLSNMIIKMKSKKRSKKKLNSEVVKKAA